MRHRATIRQRPQSRQLDVLVRRICELVGQLEKALESSGLAVSMPARQQALLWSFALLLARDEEHVIDGSARPLLAKNLADMALVMDRCDNVSRVANNLKNLILATGVVESPDPDYDDCRSSQLLVYLFERLVAGSDPAMRRARGAYYTPYPLVKYVVQSVDRLLDHELGIAGGLSARCPGLSVVDPACGSGAFLLGVLEHLRSVSGENCVSVEHGVSVENHGVPALGQWFQQHRLTGIDVMPASCVAAGLIVEQQAARNGMHVAIPAWSIPAWSIECGNLLADAEQSRQLFQGRIPVILGNPPYSNFGRLNREPWIIEQLGEYKRGLGEKKLNLDDDFIKFVRWAQYWVDQAGQGVVGLVTNNTYLSGLTHRKMRSSLASSFDQVYVLDLHGSSKKREVAPDGKPDENVFSIQQGVSVGLFVKTGGRSQVRGVQHADVWGTRDTKLKKLATTDVTSTSWTALEIPRPNYFFVPCHGEDAATYEAWPQLSAIFQHYVSGVQTKRDKLFVGFTRSEVETKVSRFLDAAARGEFESNVPSWLRDKATEVQFDRRLVRNYMVAPLDVRWVYYEPRLLGRARHQLLRHLDKDNVALVFMRQTTNPPPYDHFLVTDMLVSDRVFYSAHGAPFIAPLFLRDGLRVTANLASDFVQRLADLLGVPFRQNDAALPTSFGAPDVLNWIYAAVHDNVYRQQFQTLLSIDFPRIPWPENSEHFAQLCDKGKRLVETHVGATRSAIAVGTEGGSTGTELQRGFPCWQAGRLWLNSEFALPESVEETVWNARIGGYQVLPRWLKQRRGRSLDAHDLDCLHRLISALRAILDQSSATA